jgi:phenylacetate-CoA oxygenase PaaH subunit
MDTQWPSYIVFDQPKEGKPAFYAGSVHAPDPEIALQNARDVFGRRDDHIRLWVVRESQIFAKTAEELAHYQLENLIKADDAEIYLVFQKNSHKGTLVQAGEVQALGYQDAMLKALVTYSNPKAVVWWVFPASSIHYTDPAEHASLFSPGQEKAFRHSSHYPTVTLMREISLANEKLNWEDE